MEALCTPAIATAAIFVALLFLDLFRREFHLLPAHSLFGFVSVLLMSVLCQNNANFVAWGLLAFPFVILVLGWGMMALKATDTSTVPYRIGNVTPAPNPCATCTKPVTRCACPQKLIGSDWT